MATIVFDLDGTLVDTAPDLIGTLIWLFEREGLPPVDLAEATSLIGAGMKPMIEKALHRNGRGSSPDELERVYKRYIGEYETRLTRESRPYPGLLAALDLLDAQGMTLAVCTNKLEYMAKLLLTELDLTKRFKFISGADTYEAKKPDARHLLNTIRDAGGSPQKAVMIGDSKTDISAAKNASVPVIGFSGGYTEIPLKELQPDAIIDHYNELIDVLAELRIVGV